MIATRRFADSARKGYASRRRPSTWRNQRVSRFQLAPAGSTTSSVSRTIDVPVLLRSSNRSDSRQRLQSGLCLGFANSLPFAAGAMVFEVCQIGVLRRKQPVLFGLGLRP